MSLPILNLRSTLRMDPTRTATLRRRYMAEMGRRFRNLRVLVRKAIVELDVLGIREREPFTFNEELVTHQLPEREAFRFLSNPEKVTSFNRWFQEQVEAEILSVGAGGDPWTSKYVHSAYKQGSLRAYMDSHPEAMSENLDFYRGRREQFLESAFNQPERLSKIRLLYTRSYEDLKGITNAMSQQISRHLADGLSQGLNPNTIARTLARDIDQMTRTRARTMARTEVIHAHAEGQLDSFEEMGVQELLVMAEWSTAGDDRVCPKCAALEGTVMTVEEARGLIPRHPNCRCAWIPANVGELEARRKRYWSILEKKNRINKSLMAGLPKKTRAGRKVPQTVREAKRRSTWPGKLLKPKEPPKSIPPLSPEAAPPPPPALEPTPTRTLTQIQAANREKEIQTAKEWAQNLDGADRQALGGWAQNDFQRIRAAQRGQRPYGISKEEWTKERIQYRAGVKTTVTDKSWAEGRAADLERIYAEAPKVHQPLYRGMRLTPDQLKRMLEGEVFSEEAFSSYSMDREIGERFAKRFAEKGKVRVLLNVRNGEGVNITEATVFKDESEVLVHRSKKLKVVSSKKLELTGRGSGDKVPVTELIVDFVE